MRTVRFPLSAAILVWAALTAPVGAQDTQTRTANFVSFSVPGATGGNGLGTFPTGFNPGRGMAVVGVWENRHTMGAPMFLRASNGTITPIEPPGSVLSFPVLDPTINAAGTIAGFYVNARNTYRGFLESRSGSFTIFALPDRAAVFSNAPAINIKGAVTGNYALPHKFPVGFLRDPDGTFTEFTAPEPRRGTLDGTFPLSINADGMIVGYYVIAVKTPTKFILEFHGFTRTPDGKLTAYDVPDASSTFLDSINDKGDIAGNYYDSKDTSHGFLLTANGSLSRFDVPGAGPGHPGNPKGTFVVGMSPSRVITGGYNNSQSRFGHGYLRSRDGTITTFDFPGAGNAAPVGINANCVIAGSYSDAKGTSHGFLRIPAGCN
jgi:hypothetical protein